MVSFWAEVKFFSFWPKTMDYIIRRFDRNIKVILCGPFYSTVEGAMKLKSASF